MSGMDDFEAYRAAARAGGVPDEAVELALGLARPQVELSSSPGPDAVLAGRYGGWPSLPVEVEWEGYPDFVASVDCAFLPRVFDFPFPAEGSLLFFADRRDAEGPESERGAGFVVYVGADAVVEERVPEDGEAVYGEPVPLFARSLWSLPMPCDDVVLEEEGRRGVYERYRLDQWDERRGVARVELLLGVMGIRRRILLRRGVGSGCCWRRVSTGSGMIRVSWGVRSGRCGVGIWRWGISRRCGW